MNTTIVLLFILLIILILVYTSVKKAITGGADVQFSVEEIDFMKKLLSEGHMRPPIGESQQTDQQHVQHGFCQMIRFAQEAKNGKEFRTAQFCLNLGRVQEILQSIGGVKCWWKTYEPLILEKKYQEIIDTTYDYLDTLGLKRPDDKKINNKCDYTEDNSEDKLEDNSEDKLEDNSEDKK